MSNRSSTSRKRVKSTKKKKPKTTQCKGLSAAELKRRRKRFLKEAITLLLKKEEADKGEPPYKTPHVIWVPEPEDAAPEPSKVSLDEYDPITLGMRCIVLRHKIRDKRYCESFRGTVSDTRYDKKLGYGVCTIALDDGCFIHEIAQCHVSSNKRPSTKWKKKQPPPPPEELKIKCADCGTDRVIKQCDLHHASRCKPCQTEYNRARARERRKTNYHKKKGKK